MKNAPVRRSWKCPEPKVEPAMRADSFLNMMTGLNVSGFDKRRATSFLGKRMTEFEAEELWRGDDILERAIETIPLVTMRNGFEVVVSDEEAADEEPVIPTKDDANQDPLGDPTRMDRVARRRRRQHQVRKDKIDKSQMKREMQRKLAKLEVVTTFITAQQYARAYGGSAIWMGIDEIGKQWKDVDRLKKRLDPNRIKDIRHLMVLRPHECWPIRWYQDPLEPNFGTPSHFYVQRDSQSGSVGGPPLVVHESRLIRFFGSVTSRRQMATNNSWGDPVLLRFIEIVADFQSSFQAAAHLVNDFAQAVQKVKGLAELIAAGDTKTVEKRAEMVAMARSIARTVLIDSEEEYTREQTPLSGLSDLLDRFAKRVAASVHMPVTLLFGESPAGLNATGETDVRWFYDEVANKRELHLRGPLELLIRYIFLSTEGPTAGEEPSIWKVVFNPLWQPTQKEIAERNKLQAEADSLYVTMQAVTPEEIGDSRFGGDEWSPETKLDHDLRDKVKKAHEAMVDETVAEGNIPQASAAKAAGQQAAVELAVAQPEPKPGEEAPKADPKAKKKAA